MYGESIPFYCGVVFMLQMCTTFHYVPLKDIWVVCILVSMNKAPKNILAQVSE